MNKNYLIKKRPLKASNVGFCIIIIRKTHRNCCLNYLEPIKKGVKFGTCIAERKALNYLNNLKRRKYVFRGLTLRLFLISLFLQGQLLTLRNWQCEKAPRPTEKSTQTRTGSKLNFEPIFAF